jgi:hypothetical protein
MSRSKISLVSAWATLGVLLSGCSTMEGAKGGSQSQGGMSASAATPASAAAPAASNVDWTMNATIIEACSCPMFCQCYFSPQPATHGPGCCLGGSPGTYCMFNNAYQVNAGHYGQVKLDGAKFWLGGDLGGDFSKGEMQWAVLTFDPSVTKEQREGIQAVLARVYPVKWNSFTVSPDAPIEWKATRDRAEARLDGGKGGEVILKKNQGMTDDPIVIKNLRYWSAPRNDGFVLMQNQVEAYRRGAKTFEFKGSNGFMITFDINSKDGEKA